MCGNNRRAVRERPLNLNNHGCSHNVVPCHGQGSGMPLPCCCCSNQRMAPHGGLADVGAHRDEPSHRRGPGFKPTTMRCCHGAWFPTPRALTTAGPFANGPYTRNGIRCLPSLTCHSCTARGTNCRELLTIARDYGLIISIGPQGPSCVVISVDRNETRGGIAYSGKLSRRPFARLLCRQRCLSIHWVTAMENRPDG